MNEAIEAISVIKNKFKDFDYCTLRSISYTSDERSQKEQDEKGNDEMIVFESSFHTSARACNDGFNSNFDYSGWNWILSRKNGGQWKLVTYGYG